MRKNIYKILVTGGAGFIGSEFVRQLLNRDCPRAKREGLSLFRVIVVDKLTYAGDLTRLEEVKGKYKFYKEDICNSSGAASIIQKEKPGIIVNFAAQTHVDRSIIDSGPFIETNIKGTKNLLDLVLKFRLNRFIHISCYDEKTRALTTEGFKTYKELKKGDLVFSLNPLTREIEVKPIEKVIIQHYKGKMFHFKNKRIDLMVTPNHNMFILNTKKKLKVETAEKSSLRSIFFMPECCWKGVEEDIFEVKGHGKVKVCDLMYILGIFIGDGFTAYQEKEAPCKTGLNREEYLRLAKDVTTGKFKKMGKFGNHRTTMHGYRIFFDIPEHDKCREKVEQSLTNLGIKYSAHKGKAGTHLYFTSESFSELFNQCGKGAHNKQIPLWALEYAPKYLRFLFDGLMDSDGCHGFLYHTVSEKLVAGFSELCFKIGLKAHIRKRHCESFINGRKIEGEAYYIVVSKTKKSISRHRNKVIDYNGNIWCLKVPDNKNFIVERDGKLDFCGNTDEVYGDIDKGSFSENSALKPNSPYAATKAAADLLIKSYIRTYKLPAIIIRPSNNYGPWQYPEKLIPLAALMAIKNRKVPVYAKGQNVREWLYVADCARAIITIMEKGKIGEVYNVGSAQEKRNIEVVKSLLKGLNKPECLIEFVADRPGHDFRYALNCQKLKKELGWQPDFNFDKGLKNTVNWLILNQHWLNKHSEKKLSIKFKK